MGMTLHDCEMDVRTGGTYRFNFGEGMDFFGRYVEVTPPSRIVWTNEEGGEDASVTTVALTKTDGRTVVVVTERYPSAEALEFVSKVFWFSLEFGVVREHGEVRSYGAGLLSSYGEIQQVDLADLRPLNIGRMGVQTYDITHYQPILFCARGFTEIEDVVGGFFADVDDDMVERLMHDASQVTGR